MATRDQMIAEALKEVKEGIKELDRKLGVNLDSIGDLRERVTKLETRISIVFGIIAAIGIALVSALVKYIVK